jgi:hypothetical protein
MFFIKPLKTIYENWMEELLTPKLGYVIMLESVKSPL